MVLAEVHVSAEGKMAETGEFYQHRDLYDKCQACRSCLDKRYLLTPFEDRRLPMPWQGGAGPRVKVLFVFAKPSFTKFSPRISDYPTAPALRAMLDRQYEQHAIAFKRRRSNDGSIRSHARRIAALLLESPEDSISDFDDYLFTSLVRCNGDRKEGLQSLELLANECHTLHGSSLLGRLPNLQWIVVVGNMTHRLLSIPSMWQNFWRSLEATNARKYSGTAAPQESLPPLVCGVSDVISLNERIRLLAVPHFSRSTFGDEHYYRIFTSWMTRPPLHGGGAGPVLGSAPRAADANRRGRSATVRTSF